MTVPVVILASVDPIVRETALFAALADLPGTGVLRQDLDPGTSTLHRVVSDAHGVVDDHTGPLEHTCLGCAIREDSLPSLAAMAASGRWERIVWALPVGAATAPAARPLANPEVAGDLDIRLSGVLAAIDTESAAHDLFADDLLDERGLALSLDDRRSVGEALSAQLRHADLVLTTGNDPVGLALVDRLRGRGSERSDLFETEGRALLRHRHRPTLAEARIDPRLPGNLDPAGSTGVWSWTVRSVRPVHPGRFLDHLADLAGEELLSYGCFHLPGRPGQVGEWDCVGGQVSLGHAGDWAGIPAVTRLRFVGLGERPEHLADTFDQILLSDSESTQRQRWLDADDGLDPWLGRRQSAA